MKGPSTRVACWSRRETSSSIMKESQLLFYFVRLLMSKDGIRYQTNPIQSSGAYLGAKKSGMVSAIFEGQDERTIKREMGKAIKEGRIERIP